jgi:uncharacterized protein YjbI with pentapeptide repeats
MSWRTEPEIDDERRHYLSERRAIQPNVQTGMYPFRDENGGIRLDRADVEWLLTTHESEGVSGPVWWEDERDKPESARRTGLCLSGADLNGADLQALPLSCLGLPFPSPNLASALARGDFYWPVEAGMSLLNANLTGADMQHAILDHSNLGKANLSQVNLATASLITTFLEEADLTGADLDGANLEYAFLRGANLGGATLVRANLNSADLRNVRMNSYTRLGGVLLGDQRGDVYSRVSGKSGFGVAVGVAKAWWDNAQPLFYPLMALGLVLLAALALGAALGEQNMASLLKRIGIEIQGSSATPVTIIFSAVALGFLVLAIWGLLLRRDIRVLYNRMSAAHLADIHWGGVNMSVVDWGRVRILGDEHQARASGKLWEGEDPWTTEINDQRNVVPNWEGRLLAFQGAARAYRQLASELRTRGLNADADSFAFRALLMERRVYLQQFQPIRWLGSSLLDLISGYGYKPWRSFITYAVAILGFALVYLTLGGANGQSLSWNEAIVISMTAFHGRGFFSAVFQPGDLQAAVAAVEAFIGLLIEIVLIATFTQRFFAR